MQKRTILNTFVLLPKPQILSHKKPQGFYLHFSIVLIFLSHFNSINSTTLRLGIYLCYYQNYSFFKKHWHDDISTKEMLIVSLNFAACWKISRVLVKYCGVLVKIQMRLRYAALLPIPYILIAKFWIWNDLYLPYS